jgi:rhamnosyltransferase
LARAIEMLSTAGADVYSGDVLAVWENGRTQALIKSDRPRKYDHLFESAGPGCTFVFTRAAFEKLRTWVAPNCARLGSAKVHDWLFYAYARHQGWRWYVDRRIAMHYRQHGSNEVGANVGLAAARRRWSVIRSGAYREEVLTIAQLIDDSSWVSRALRRFNLFDRIRLVLAARQLRRRPRDAVLLAAFLTAMPGNRND